MTVPDKWEYPWFAAWDLAFHCVAFALVDPRLRQGPALGAAVRAVPAPQRPDPGLRMGVLRPEPAGPRLGRLARLQHGPHRAPARPTATSWRRCFHKLLINFAWWVNKVDREGNNIFEGGFLGLDNITVVDRSERGADGAVLEQSDATGWMGMFCLNLMRIALELAKENPVYEGLATKFFQHYVYVAAAMKHMGNRDYQLWDEQRRLLLRRAALPRRPVPQVPRPLAGRPDPAVRGRAAGERLDRAVHGVHGAPSTGSCANRPRPGRATWSTRSSSDGEMTHVLTIVERRTSSRGSCSASATPTSSCRTTASAACRRRTQRSPSSSTARRSVTSRPRRSRRSRAATRTGAGRSGSRPRFLLIESLRKLGKAFGPNFQLRTPATRGQPITFPEMAQDFADRLIRIFTRDGTGRRPVYGGARKFQDDPHWRDLISVLRIFPRRQRRRPGRQRTRPAGRRWSPRSSTSGGGNGRAKKEKGEKEPARNQRVSFSTFRPACYGRRELPRAAAALSGKRRAARRSNASKISPNMAPKAREATAPNSGLLNS